MKKMTITRIQKQVIVFALGFIGFIASFGIVGRYDYAEQVVYDMPQEIYDAIVQKIGSKSQVAIVDEYTSNKAYWDSRSYAVK